MKTMKQIISEVVDREGGYINDTSDSGGETNYGITKSTAVAYGYIGAMIDLPYDVAIEIYKQNYWGKICGDDLIAVIPISTEKLFDIAVNLGVRRAGEFLQRSLNVMNNNGNHYPDITVDGVIGPASILSAKSYSYNRSDDVLCRAIRSLQGAFYINLAERRTKDQKFVYGWIKNRV